MYIKLRLIAKLGFLNLISILRSGFLLKKKTKYRRSIYEHYKKISENYRIIDCLILKIELCKRVYDIVIKDLTNM